MRDKLIFSPWLSRAPVMTIVLVLLGASLFYAIAESLGVISVIGQNDITLSAYRDTLNLHSEFWISLGFSLWISVASTLISSTVALLLAVWLSEHRGNTDTLALNWNLAFPHLVWSVALLLFLSQSGLLARWAAVIGLISIPAFLSWCATASALALFSVTWAKRFHFSRSSSSLFFDRNPLVTMLSRRISARANGSAYATSRFHKSCPH